MSWDIEALRNYIKLESNNKFLLELIDSISRTNEIFKYHLFAARDWSNELYDNDSSGNKKEIEIYDFIFGVSPKQEVFRGAKLASEANLIASVMIMQSRWDVFSQLVNGLLLHPVITVKECTFHKVIKKMEDSSLRDSLKEFVKESDFLYFSDFNNTIKHRQLIQHGYFYSIEKNVADIKISKFDFNSRHHSGCSGEEFLQRLNTTANYIVKFGNELNQICFAKKEH